MSIDVWFPLAVFYEDLPGAGEQNPDLARYIRQLRDGAEPCRTNDSSSWTGDIHNVDKLHLDPALSWLTDTIGREAIKYLTALGHDLSKTDVYIQRAWPIIAGKGQKVSRHAHHTAHLSAVYYVEAPKERGGAIRFFNDARPNEVSAGISGDMTGGYAQSNSLNYASALYDPIPGRLVLFPAKQTHEVLPNETDDDRISISYDLVITSRGGAQDGRHEFLMPPPSIWRRVPRSEPEMLSPEPDRPQMGEGRHALHEMSSLAQPIDAFTLATRSGHPLWETEVLPYCSPPAAWREYERALEELPAQAWIRDHSGTVFIWQGGQDWHAYRGGIDRVYAHLRDRNAALESANVTGPCVQRRRADAPPPFQRGKTHLCAYVRLDTGAGSCQLEFAEGGTMDLPSGAIALVSAMRRHRLTGDSHVLHFGIDLPALARTDGLELAGLQAETAPDKTVFAALTAQPLSHPLPPGLELRNKQSWLEARERRRQRHEDNPVVCKFLRDNCDPASATPQDLEQIRALGSPQEPQARPQVKQPVPVLSAEACQRLRQHARDHMSSVRPDSVDDRPEYQVNLTLDQLRELAGEDGLAALLSLPQTLDPELGRDGYDELSIFLRLYTPQTRPYIAFHTDMCSATANIALTPSTRKDGGNLLLLADDALLMPERKPGEAIVHNNGVVHGVSRIERGERLTLILFYTPRTPVPVAQTESTPEPAE